MDQYTMEYVAFRVDDKKRFEALCDVFNALKDDKQNGEFRADDEWLMYFEEADLSYFWWPSNRELLASDPHSRGRWIFTAMIEAFKNGEYDLVSCRMISSDVAYLEYYPYGFPYGSTQCMEALIESFGFEVVGKSDA
jgi:hypothetical protein